MGKRWVMQHHVMDGGHDFASYLHWNESPAAGLSARRLLHIRGAIVRKAHAFSRRHRAYLVIDYYCCQPQQRGQSLGVSALLPGRR